MTVGRCMSAACSDVGRVRAVNEDSFLDRPDIGLWVVADGMGGHQAGDVASRLIVEELDRIRRPTHGPALMAEVKARIRRVNHLLLEEARSRGPDAVVASTVVGLLMIDGFFGCFWAGDSRLYLYRGGRLTQLTRDHSYVQDLVDAGVLTPEQAERHPQGNVVTRAVGAEADLRLDLKQGRSFANDVFLLCSDGLTRPVDPDSITAILSRVPLAESARALVDAALERGAPDNVTAVVVKNVSG